jgi:hypothetical protein
MRIIHGYRYFAPITLGVYLFAGTALGRDWWIEAGPVFRPGMHVSVTGSSYVQMLGLHDPIASGPMAPPGDVGALNAYADRTYDNGYVKIDPGTGNPASLDPNTTWNWGFNNPSQYSPGAQTLTFQKAGAPGYNALANGSAQGSDHMLGSGLQLLGGVPVKQADRWSVDLCLGFQATWGSNKKLTTSSYREDVRQVTLTDTYDVSGIPAAEFPATGFHGTYLGPFDTPPVIPSPVIPNLPTSRSSSVGAALSTSYNSIAFDIDQSFFQLAAGPRIGWAPSRRLTLNLRPTFSLNIIDVDVNRTELFVQELAGADGTVLQRWSDRGARCEVFPGLGVSGGLDLDLGKGFFAGAFGGYEYVAKNVHVSVGPNTLTLDASSWVAGALVGIRF